MSPGIGFFSSWIYYFWLTFIRPFVKGFLRRTTGLCELQRICYATRGSSSERSLQIEQSIVLSRSKVLQRVRNRIIYQPKTQIIPKTIISDDISNELSQSESDNLLIHHAIEAICLEKSINENIHLEFVSGLKYALTQMYQFKKVTDETVELTQTPYNKENNDHVQLLLVSVFICLFKNNDLFICFIILFVFT